MLELIPERKNEIGKLQTESNLTKTLQDFLRVRDEDVGGLRKLSAEEKIKRICGRLASPIRGIADLKSKDTAHIANALFAVVHVYGKHKGFKKTDAIELAKIVTQHGTISNPSKLFNVLKSNQNFVLKGFEKFRFNFLWQTDDGFPTLVNADLQEDGVEIMNAIYYRVHARPWKAEWSRRAKEYQKELLEKMDSEFDKETPKLPDWFEDKQKPILEEKMLSFKRKLQDQKKIAKSHKCQAGCSKCIIPSNCSNIVYFWSVFLGKDFSHQLNHRSYVGMATTCKERWGKHFSKALGLIYLLVGSYMAPKEVPEIQRVELVLALAIAAEYDSALYCLDMFDDNADARKCEKQINKDLELTKLSKGLNKIL